jgi:hypothetical protein
MSDRENHSQSSATDGHCGPGQRFSSCGLCIFFRWKPRGHQMATKDEQETLRLLVQHVSRAFYEPKYTIILDQLARNPV